MQVFPNTLSRLTNNVGKLLTPWIQYLQQFTQAPPKFVTLSVGRLAFAYVAKEPGFIYISGGTVSSVSLIRGSDTLDVTGQMFIPVSINDTILISLTVAPVVKFIPIYGAVPG